MTSHRTLSTASQAHPGRQLDSRKVPLVIHTTLLLARRRQS